MKTFNSILMTLAITVSPVVANAAEPFEPATKLRPNMTLALYPEGQKVNKGIEENGKTITLGPGESNKIAEPEEMKASGTMSKVGDNARIDIYLPKKPNGQMIVVCPGGGYKNLSTFNEGAYVADWLIKRGISVCVVKYRLPNGHWNVPLNDVQNAFRYCRAHAQEWGVNQIGVMGFSAGGHLAASASTLFVDTVTRPDFSVLIYPVITMDLALTHKGTHDNLIGKESKWLDENLPVKDYLVKKAKYEELMYHYSLQNNVSADTPPTFLALSTGDNVVAPENSFLYYDALVAHNVPALIYVYPYGGHGWGFTTPEFGKDKLGAWRPVFFQSLEIWLNEVSAK